MRHASAQVMSLKHSITLNESHDLLNTKWPGGGLAGPLWSAEGALYVNSNGSMAVLVGIVLDGQLIVQLLAFVNSLLTVSLVHESDK